MNIKRNYAKFRPRIYAIDSNADAKDRSKKLDEKVITNTRNAEYERNWRHEENNTWKKEFQEKLVSRKDNCFLK